MNYIEASGVYDKFNPPFSSDGYPATQIDGEELLYMHDESWEDSFSTKTYDNDEDMRVYELTHSYYGFPWPLTLTGCIVGYSTYGNKLAIKLGKSKNEPWEPKLIALKHLSSAEVLERSHLTTKVKLVHAPLDDEGFIYVELEDATIIDTLPPPGSEITIQAEVIYRPTGKPNRPIGTHDLVLNYQYSKTDHMYPNTRSSRRMKIIHILEKDLI